MDGDWQNNRKETDIFHFNLFLANNKYFKDLKINGFVVNEPFLSLFQLNPCPFNDTVMHNNDVKGLPVTRDCSNEYETPHMELFWDKPDSLPGKKKHFLL